MYASIDVQYSVNKKPVMLSITQQKQTPKRVGTRAYTEIAHTEARTVTAATAQQNL